MRVLRGIYLAALICLIPYILICVRDSAKIAERIFDSTSSESLEDLSVLSIKSFDIDESLRNELEEHPDRLFRVFPVVSVWFEKLGDGYSSYTDPPEDYLSENASRFSSVVLTLPREKISFSPELSKHCGIDVAKELPTFARLAPIFDLTNLCNALIPPGNKITLSEMSSRVDGIGRDVDVEVVPFRDFDYVFVRKDGSYIVGLDWISDSIPSEVSNSLGLDSSCSRNICPFKITEATMEMGDEVRPPLPVLAQQFSSYFYGNMPYVSGRLDLQSGDTLHIYLSPTSSGNRRFFFIKGTWGLPILEGLEEQLWLLDGETELPVYPEITHAAFIRETLLLRLKSKDIKFGGLFEMNLLVASALILGFFLVDVLWSLVRSLFLRQRSTDTSGGNSQ